MVDFFVFNELSLPIRKLNEFENFFEVLSKLKSLGFKKIRMDKPFTHYPEILYNKTFQEVIGQIKDRNKQRRLLSFINSATIAIESPLIKDDEIEDNEENIANTYYYNHEETFGGLACCDIWNTIAISFNSSDNWDKDTIYLKKNNTDVNIKHTSKIEHLTTHRDFFNALEKEKKLKITQSNFWENKKINFPDKIEFCKEVEDNLKNLDSQVFKSAIGILRDIEKGNKNLIDFNYSGESSTVKDDPKLKKVRLFSINGKKHFFENHIKNLPNGHRVYFLEKDNKIHIGYIGVHLPTKKHK